MNDRSGVYVPPGNRDRTGGSSSGSKLEDTLAKVLQKVESTDAGVKEMKGDFSSISQLVDSHTTSTKQIEQQLGKLSASLNQRKNGSLPSDTIQNPKKDGYCMAITTRSDKILIEPIFADVFDEEESGASIEERFVGGTLEAVLMNFEADFGNDYVETKNAL
uniref:Integrase core domain containing protein n=1 Tax=Solanum tuberosum TaxID=4113 RepID=M1D8Z6_SOLTU